MHTCVLAEGIAKMHPSLASQLERTADVTRIAAVIDVGDVAQDLNFVDNRWIGRWRHCLQEYVRELQCLPHSLCSGRAVLDVRTKFMLGILN